MAEKAFYNTFSSQQKELVGIFDEKSNQEDMIEDLLMFNREFTSPGVIKSNMPLLTDAKENLKRIYEKEKEISSKLTEREIEEVKQYHLATYKKAIGYKEKENYKNEGVHRQIDQWN